MRARRRRAALTCAALEAVDAPVVLCDEDGLPFAANAAARTLLGPQPPPEALAGGPLALGGRRLHSVVRRIDGLGSVVTVTDVTRAERHAEDLAAIAAITRLMTTADVDETATLLVAAARKRTGAVSAQLWQRGEEGLVVTHEVGDGPPAAEGAHRAEELARPVTHEDAIFHPVGTDGVLSVRWDAPPDGDHEHLARLMQVLADHAAAALERARLHADLEALATTDELTGLPNRRAWQLALGRTSAVARRHGTPFAVAMLDLDRFKAFNDAYGHVAGDRLLREAAEAWQRELRPNDVLARWGGEEFVLLLPHTDAAGARDVVERLRSVTPGAQTCSAGIVGAGAEDDPTTLLQRADEALYRAKAAGRDRVVVFGAAPETVLEAVPPADPPAVRALAAAVLARDASTAQHCHAVLELVRAVAAQLGLPPAQRAEAEQVALLHDLGKLCVPDAILHKPGPLDDGEWEVMRGHPSAGGRLVAAVPGLEHLAPAIEAEHERWDGRGYPQGLAGEAIPLAARISAVCDAFHAMTSDRPYRRALPVDEALREIEQGAGRQFDPRAARALLAVAS